MQARALSPPPPRLIYSDQPRERGIGASQVATAIGLNPYRSPLSLWFELTGRLEKATPDPLDPWAMESKAIWGNRFEPIIRAHYADRSQVPVVVPTGSFYLAAEPWKRATPDGLIGPANDEQPLVGPWQRALQIKLVGARQARRWPEDGDSGNVPPEYLVQVTWEQHVLDVPEHDLAALVGGTDYRQFRLYRDADFEASIVEAAAEFMGYVQRDEPPPVDASKDWADYLRAQIEKKGADIVAPATPETDALAVELRELVERMRDDEKRADEIENQLKAAMVAAGAVQLEVADGRFTWRQSKDRIATDWEAAFNELVPLLVRLAQNRRSGKGQIAKTLDTIRERHTTTTKGNRPFNRPSTWRKK